MDYDTWITIEPEVNLFCPLCMREVLMYEYDFDEQINIATCECGWRGDESELLRAGDMKYECAIQYGDCEGDDET